MRSVLLLFLISSFCAQLVSAQAIDTTFITPFERSEGTKTATYSEAFDFYKRLRDAYPKIVIGDVGPTDIGYPLRSVSYSADGNFNKDIIKKENRIVILINNDIHAGEPDGVDACMMMLRDAAMGKLAVPKNIVLVVIPMYNIGGALNRNTSSRANQNGPESYGFRGNSRNLDLNRDFIKCDASETIGLEDLFSKISPDIFIDNHVSDGADYQHVMTLLATQHDKLGGATGDFMYKTFTPALFSNMKERGYDVVPYVNDFDKTPDVGWREFYDLPRFSSGYAALSQILAYVPETHMLKPFKDRVTATYTLMQSFIQVASAHALEIKTARNKDKAALLNQKEFALDWVADTTRCDSVLLKGYEGAYKPSAVSGQPRLYYDHNKPFSRNVPFYDHYIPSKTVKAPKAYIIPKTWIPAISTLRTNAVRIQRLTRDTTITVTAYHIDSYESVSKPYERHYLHKNVKVTPQTTPIRFSEGDYVVWLNQPAKRYLIEILEPTAPDALFAWNYFDGILQQKEGYSPYVFEDIAAQLLEKDPALKALLEDKRKADPVFAADGAAQLDFVYHHSPYFEQEFMRYPVYRLE